VDSRCGDRLSDEQLRKIVSRYLDEVVRCYQEQQRVWPETGRREFGRLEQKADELLQAMMSSIEPGERRRAVLQVLSRAREHREPNLPS
jgi:hypothetical protein